MTVTKYDCTGCGERYDDRDDAIACAHTHDQIAYSRKVRVEEDADGTEKHAVDVEVSCTLVYEADSPFSARAQAASDVADFVGGIGNVGGMSVGTSMSDRDPDSE